MIATTVALLAVALTAPPQNPRLGSVAWLEAQEKRVADHPESLDARKDLLESLAAYGSILPTARARALRRQQIAWFIEHHPEAPVLASWSGMIQPSGPGLSDPEDYAAIAQLWRKRIASADTPTIAIVHAALFLFQRDPTEARTLSNRVWPSRQDDPQAAWLRAGFDLMDLLGTKKFPNTVDIDGNGAAFDSPAGRQARQELEQSTNVALLAAAGDMVGRFAHVSFMPTGGGPWGGGPDIWKEASQWLEQARRLDPKNDAVSDELAHILSQRAMHEVDKRERVKLARRAFDMAVSDFQRARMLWFLAGYELEAGDKDAAKKDAQTLLELAGRGIKMPDGGPDMGKFLSDQARKIIEQASAAPSRP